MRIAVHQMCSGTAPLYNVEKMAVAIYQSSETGAKMYFAPEMSFMLDKDRNRAAENIVSESGNEGLKYLADVAGKCRMWVHIGSMPILDRASGKYANRSIVIDADGQIRARYDKMHLFDVDLSTGESWRESSSYLPGSGPIAVQCPLGLMGLSICYDLRFPDLYSAYAKCGVDVLAVPAAFTVPTGQAHWHALLRARAIEAQAFVIAAAQSGAHEDGRQTFGHSLVIDPWGEILLDMNEMESIGYANLDLNRIAEVRSQIPAQHNRREITMPVKIC
jgi:deaminated glutathione amidase